jgi:hypothetical protein
MEDSDDEWPDAPLSSDVFGARKQMSEEVEMDETVSNKELTPMEASVIACENLVACLTLHQQMKEAGDQIQGDVKDYLRVSLTLLMPVVAEA